VRVLHVIPSVSPLRGGPSRAVLAMVQALRDQGVEASILTTNDHGPGIDPTLRPGRWSEREGVPLLAFRRWSPPLAPLREFAISPGLVGWLGRHIRDYDLLHVHAIFSFPSTWAMVQARQAGVPYLVRTIGQLSPWSLGQSSGRKRWMLRLVERANLEGAAALHFTTRAERDEAAALGLAAPTLILPLGVRPPESATAGATDVLPPAGNEGARFLFLSRLHPKKQLERLLQALAILMRRQPEAAWRLTIVGSGPPAYEQQLRALADRLGLAERCRWLGHLEGSAKQEQLLGADWLVLPSAAENFGIAVAEALVCGTPVIVSPEVAMAELVAEAGAGLVCSSEPEALAATLSGALAGPTAAMRQAAFNLAEQRLAWNAIAAELRSAYAALVRNP
jgi:glycosyltransferase involved in cell wall biosynthesis